MIEPSHTGKPQPHHGHENAHHHAPRDPAPRRHDGLGSGVDVSSNNGDVDWDKVKGAGVNEAFAKVTEGVTFDDPSWSKARVNAMARAGLRCGAYHFARPDNNDPEAELDHFLNRVSAMGAHLIGFGSWRFSRPGWLGVLDFETAPFSASWAAAWATRFHDKVGHRPLLYGYGSSLASIAANPKVLDLFSGVWLAAYTADWPPYWDGPQEAVKLWQYSDNGTCPGIAGPVDLTRRVNP